MAWIEFEALPVSLDGRLIISGKPQPVRLAIELPEVADPFLFRIARRRGRALLSCATRMTLKTTG